jgi:hypothetical protein
MFQIQLSVGERAREREKTADVNRRKSQLPEPDRSLT